MMRATALPSMILRRVFILGRTKEVVERLLWNLLNLVWR